MHKFISNRCNPIHPSRRHKSSNLTSCSSSTTSLTTIIPAVVPTEQNQQVADTLRAQLEQLLGTIPRFLKKATDQTEQTATRIPQAAANLFAKDGPFGFLQFWRDNQQNIDRTADQIRQSGQNLIKGDNHTFREKASEIDFSWLNPKRQSSSTTTTTNNNNSQTNITPTSILNDDDLREQFISKARNLISFAVDSLTPWDFDRHDFNLTFANTWLDVDAFKRNDSQPVPVVKMISTIKPLDAEWKLSARSKLMELGQGGVVFGKAGIYLAGDYPPYIGVEADRVWTVPRISDFGTKLFANVNYRSSRKPHKDPIKSTFGIQQDFPITNAFVLTLRIGIDPLQRDRLFVTPVPNGSYF